MEVVKSFTVCQEAASVFYRALSMKGLEDVFLFQMFRRTDPEVPGSIPGATRFSEK
jgi:hypothetical protein